MQTASDAEKIDHTDKKTKQNKTKQKTTKKTPTAKLEYHAMLQIGWGQRKTFEKK